MSPVISRQRISSMINSCVNVSGKLPQGLVQLYTDISHHARVLGIDILVVGAMARDLVLVHGYGASIERGTRDVDFGVRVKNWDDFNQLRECLMSSGYTADSSPHCFHCPTRDNLPWQIDIIPFGDIAEAEKISWPPGHDVVMNVLGFTEALATALKVQISHSPKVVIPVASPAGICLLKLVAWIDREIDKRAKDAADIKYLLNTYQKIPEIFDALYDDDYMERQDWDEEHATAMKLGYDAGSIASQDLANFLKNELLFHEVRKEQFVEEMTPRSSLYINEALMKRFEIFIKAFCSAVDDE